MQNIEADIDDTYKRLVVIWAAILFSQPIFFIISLFVAPGASPLRYTGNFAGENLMVTAVLAFVSFDSLVLSFVLARWMYRRAAAESKPALVQSGLIVGCALAEVASLCGMVLAFAFRYEMFYVWIAVGTLAIVMHFPSRARIAEAMPRIV